MLPWRDTCGRATPESRPPGVTLSDTCCIRSNSRHPFGSKIVYLISSLPAAASPQALLAVNRDHWRIEIMHRNKDVILGEDGDTNRCDNAPRNIFSLPGFVLEILKSVAASPTRAIAHSGRQKPRHPVVLRFLLNRPA
jgi:predicted transposase YbfD/YdcC